MSWITEKIPDHERVIFETRLFMVPLILTYIIPFIDNFAFSPLLRFARQEFFVTTSRVFIKSGIYHHEVVEIPLDRITDTTITQTIFGHLFGYGSIEIVSTSDNNHLKYYGVNKAMEFIQAIEHAQKLWGESLNRQ